MMGKLGVGVKVGLEPMEAVQDVVTAERVETRT